MKPTETSAAMAKFGASAKTILALLPPNSRLTRFRSRICRRGHDLAADLARAGEGDTVDIVMLGQRGACLVVAGNYLQHAFRHAGFERKLGDAPGKRARRLRQA